MELKKLTKEDAIKQKRFKALIYGDPNAGKTMMALHFPEPYIIDTERGAENEEYSKLIIENKGGRRFTYDYDEVTEIVLSLISQKHEFKTLVIDPITTIYEDLMEKGEKIVGTHFQAHAQYATNKIKKLFRLLLRLDMNVILTSHLKGKWKSTKNSRGKVVLEQHGNTYDAGKKLDYLFDLSIEVEAIEKDDDTVERIGIVKKTRVEGFPERERFKWSYEELCTRHGKKSITNEVNIEELATPPQINILMRLINLLHVPRETQDKWLNKADSSRWEEMSKEKMKNCIDYLEEKIKNAKTDHLREISVSDLSPCSA